MGTSKSEGRKGIGTAVALILLAVHVGLVSRSYPPSVLMQREIPLKGDVSRYFATAHGSANVEGLYGYDPHFMAGYPVGLWNSMGKKGFEIVHMLMPWLPLPALFYVVITAVSLMAPLLMWLALRTHCPTGRSAWILFALSLIYWHLDTNIAYFWDFGNVFFPAMSCMLVILVVLTWNTVQRDNAWGSAVLAGIVAAVIFYCHTVVLLTGVVPVFLALMTCRRKITNPRAWALPGTALLAFAVLAAWWLVPLLGDTASCLAQPKEWFQAGPKHFIMDVFSDRAYRHHWDRTFLFHVAVVLGVAGMALARRRDENKLSLAGIMGMGGVAALVITYGFSYVPLLSTVQPHRFMIPATVLFLLPASVCVDWMITTLAESGKKTRVVAFLLLLIMLPEFTGYLIDKIRPPMGCGSDPARERMLEELGKQDVRGRVLCDDSDLGRMIPYRCGLPVIGGLSAQAFVKHRFAGTDDDGIAFGRPAKDWRADEFKKYLRVYGVDRAVFSRPEWLEFARANPDLFVPECSHGRATLFTVKGAEPGWWPRGRQPSRPTMI